MARQIRRFGYRPVFCLRVKGSIQRERSLSHAASRRLLFLSLAESPNETRSASSPVDIMRIFPQESQLHKARLLSLFELSLLLRLPKS